MVGGAALIFCLSTLEGPLGEGVPDVQGRERFRSPQLPNERAAGWSCGHSLFPQKMEGGIGPNLKGEEPNLERGKLRERPRVKVFTAFTAGND